MLWANCDAMPLTQLLRQAASCGRFVLHLLKHSDLLWNYTVFQKWHPFYIMTSAESKHPRLTNREIIFEKFQPIMITFRGERSYVSVTSGATIWLSSGLRAAIGQAGWMIYFRVNLSITVFYPHGLKSWLRNCKTRQRSENIVNPFNALMIRRHEALMSPN